MWLCSSLIDTTAGRQTGLNHFALRITDRDEWVQTVEREGLEVRYDGVVEWPNSEAWYINDPTGYEIEVAWWRNGEPAFGPAATN